MGIAGEAGRRLDDAAAAADFSRQHLSNLAWALATLEHDPGGWGRAGGRACKCVVGRGGCLGQCVDARLGGCARSRAHACLSPTHPRIPAGKKTLNAMGAALVSRADLCSPQELSNSGALRWWGQGRLRLLARDPTLDRLHPARHPPWAWPAARRFPGPGSTCCAPYPACAPSPSRAVWAFAKLNHYHGGLMDAMAAEAARRIEEFRWVGRGGGGAPGGWGRWAASAPGSEACGSAVPNSSPGLSVKLQPCHPALPAVPSDPAASKTCPTWPGPTPS